MVYVEVRLLGFDFESEEDVCVVASNQEEARRVLDYCNDRYCDEFPERAARQVTASYAKGIYDLTRLRYVETVGVMPRRLETAREREERVRRFDRAVCMALFLLALLVFALFAVHQFKTLYEVYGITAF